MGDVMRLAVVATVAVLALTTGVAGAAGPLFQPYVAIDVGSWPSAVAIGDVTGDGRADVVMTTDDYFDPDADFRLWVFEQTAEGELAEPVSYETAGGASEDRLDSVAVGDITGDGLADVVLGVTGVGVQVFPQLAAGSLGAPTLVSTPIGRLLRLGRLDGDAHLDVAWAGWGSGSVGVLLNDGAGHLLPPVLYPTALPWYDDLEVGDVTGDGLDDVVAMIGGGHGPNLTVLPQRPTGGFGPSSEYRVDSDWATDGLGVGDMTGDGRSDVVASYGGNGSTARIAVFGQSRTGRLATPISYASYDIPEPVEVADVNLDGRPDIVTLHGGWLHAGVYLGQSQPGSLWESLFAIPYASHYATHGLAVGDISNDGRPDVTLADSNHGLVVLYGVPQDPPSADVGVSVGGSLSRSRTSVRFEVTVTNHGPDTTTVTLAVQVSPNVTDPDVSSSACVVTRRQLVRCSFSGFKGIASIQITGAVPSGGTATATASIDGEADDPNSANDQDSASVVVP